MRNKAPAGVEHVRVSSGAGLDLRYDFPNELEVHLSNDHAVITTTTGYGDCHIRFGPINEINRPVIDLIRHRLDENRIVRIINVALGYIHRVARNSEFFASRRVKLSDLRYRRDLAQQAHGIETPFLQCDRVPGQWDDPGHLGFDFFHELADARCRGFGLPALNLNE